MNRTMPPCLGPRVRDALLALLLTGTGQTAWADDVPGMARIIDSPALSDAFAKANEGEIELSVDIDADGRVTAYKVVRSVPAGVFDAAAIEWVRQHRYKPQPERGKRVAIHFRADAAPQELVSPP